VSGMILYRNLVIVIIITEKGMKNITRREFGKNGAQTTPRGIHFIFLSSPPRRGREARQTADGEHERGEWPDDVETMEVVGTGL